MTRTMRIVLFVLAAVILLTAVAISQDQEQQQQEKPRFVYLRDGVVAVLRGPVRDMSVNDRYNMIQECICAALSDAKVHSKDAKIVIAAKDEMKYMGSYKFQIRKGDRLLMVGKHIIHVITPEDIQTKGSTIDAQAKYLLNNLKKQFDRAKPTGSEVMVNKKPGAK